MLLHGRDPLTRRLAEEITAGHTTEAAAMRAPRRAAGAGGQRGLPDPGRHARRRVRAALSAGENDAAAPEAAFRRERIRSGIAAAKAAA